MTTPAGWGLCSAHRKPAKGCRICDLGTFTSLPAALEALGCKKREPAPILDAPPPAPDPLVLHDPGIW